jgi:hypothetical protein
MKLADDAEAINAGLKRLEEEKAARLRGDPPEFELIPIEVYEEEFLKEEPLPPWGFGYFDNRQQKE